MIGILALNFKEFKISISGVVSYINISSLHFVILKAITINILPVFSKCSLKVIDLEISLNAFEFQDV